MPDKISVCYIGSVEHFPPFLYTADGPEIDVDITGVNTQCSPVMLNYDCTATLEANVIITCRVSANPQATLTVIPVDEDNVEVDNDGNSAMITVTDLAMANFGVYQCIANNTVAGIEFEQAVNVQLSLGGMYTCMHFTECVHQWNPTCIQYTFFTVCIY